MVFGIVDVLKRKRLDPVDPTPQSQQHSIAVPRHCRSRGLGPLTMDFLSGDFLRNQYYVQFRIHRVGIRLETPRTPHHGCRYVFFFWCSFCVVSIDDSFHGGGTLARRPHKQMRTQGMDETTIPMRNGKGRLHDLRHVFDGLVFQDNQHAFGIQERQKAIGLLVGAGVIHNTHFGFFHRHRFGTGTLVVRRFAVIRRCRSFLAAVERYGLDAFPRGLDAVHSHQARTRPRIRVVFLNRVAGCNCEHTGFELAPLDGLGPRRVLGKGVLQRSSAVARAVMVAAASEPDLAHRCVHAPDVKELDGFPYRAAEGCHQMRPLWVHFDAVDAHLVGVGRKGR
mmetsp:Transcript_9717/g.23768  ORF Transcript_9717/g.23768 Transcript_9717/m.23768 type:complete len:337 (-) Transcript_9717:1387-2397(-)